MFGFPGHGGVFGPLIHGSPWFDPAAAYMAYNWECLRRQEAVAAAASLPYKLHPTLCGSELTSRPLPPTTNGNNGPPTDFPSFLSTNTPAILAAAPPAHTGPLLHPSQHLSRLPALLTPSTTPLLRHLTPPSPSGSSKTTSSGSNRNSSSPLSENGKNNNNNNSSNINNNHHSHYHHHHPRTNNGQATKSEQQIKSAFQQVRPKTDKSGGPGPISSTVTSSAPSKGVWRPY